MAIERWQEYAKLSGIPKEHIEFLNGEEEITDEKKAQLKEESDEYIKMMYEGTHGKANKTDKENFAHERVVGYELKIKKAFNKAFGLGLTGNQLKEFKDFEALVNAHVSTIQAKGESSGDEKFTALQAKYNTLNDQFMSLESNYDTKLQEKQAEFDTYKTNKDNEVRVSDAKRNIGNYYKSLTWDDPTKVTLYTDFIDNFVFSNYHVNADGTVNASDDPSSPAMYEGKPVKRVEQIADALREKHSMIPRSNGNESPQGQGVVVPSINGGKIVKSADVSPAVQKMAEEFAKAKKG